MLPNIVSWGTFKNYPIKIYFWLPTTVLPLNGDLHGCYHSDKNLHDMTRATFIQRPVSNMDHTNQNKPVLANQLLFIFLATQHDVEYV